MTARSPASGEAASLNHSPRQRRSSDVFPSPGKSRAICRCANAAGRQASAPPPARTWAPARSKGDGQKAQKRGSAQPPEHLAWACRHDRDDERKVLRNGDDQVVHDEQLFHALVGETFEEPAADVSSGSSQLMLRKNTHDPGMEVVESQVTTARLVRVESRVRSTLSPTMLRHRGSRRIADCHAPVRPSIRAVLRQGCCCGFGVVVAFSTPKGQIQ